MNLQQIQETLREERTSDRLQPISDTFYSDTESYLRNLRHDREEAAEDAPNVFDSREVMNLSHKIQRAEETIENLYNRRVGKIINQAVLAASGGTFDKEPLTETEQDLYDTIIEAVNDNRANALDVLSDGANTNSMFSTDRESTNTVSSLTDETNVQPTTEEVNSDANNAADYMGDGSAEVSETQADTDDTTAEATPDSTNQSGGFAADVSFGEETETETENDNTDTPPDADKPEPEPPSPPEQSDSDTPVETLSDETDDFTDEFASAPETDTHNDAPTTNLPDEPQQQTKTETDDQPDDISRVTVQVTQDIGEVCGTDNRTYDLAEEDVVSLPEENAKPLLENNAATTID